MTRTQRLKPVVRHTDKKEQRALREVARSQGAFELEQGRLRQLEDYRLEYQQNKKQELGLYSPVELQEFNRFMQQLDQTIERQVEVVELHRRELDQKRRSWDTTRIDARVMHKAVDRLKQQEVAEQEREEQKTQDEFAQRNNKRR